MTPLAHLNSRGCDPYDEEICATLIVRAATARTESGPDGYARDAFPVIENPFSECPVRTHDGVGLNRTRDSWSREKARDPMSTLRTLATYLGRCASP